MPSKKIILTVCAFAMFFLFGQIGFAQNAPSPGKGKGDQEMKATEMKPQGDEIHFLPNDPLQEMMKGKGTDKKVEDQAQKETSKAKGPAKADGQQKGKGNTADAQRKRKNASATSRQ